MKAGTLLYIATAVVAGLLFGAGLHVSQMVDPLKVLRFLDLAAISSDGWDPSLAFVMIGAIPVMFAAVRYGRLRGTPLFDRTFFEPEYSRIDAPLVIGSALFGVGWGMSGVCPGPAISLLAFWPDNLLILLGSMFVGSYAGSLVMRGGGEKQLVPAE